MAQTETKEDLLKNSTDVLLHSTISKEASPESKCPICLDHFKNISYLNVCLHKFCFLCIREWSKNKAECPLCKQPFRSIYHTIKAENDYKRFDLRPTENGSFGNVAGQRFRYRTTLTGDHRPAPRRTSPPPDHGILFEGLNGSLPQHQNRDLHRMMRRMAARRLAESEGRAVRSLREQEVVKFRRALYRRGVRVQSVQDRGRSRETSAEFFQKNPACLHRLVPWLRRELTVLYGTHGSFANILQHIIMTLITRHNLDDQIVLHELRPFLLSHTEHFLHEFLRFAQSPFNMEAYDQHAVYDMPGPATESSSSDTSVIAISEDESDSLVAESQDFATPRVTLSQTAWDDETPGPSYTSEPSQVFPLHVRDSDSDSSTEEPVVSVAAVTHQDHSPESDKDCVIIGYVKPVAERTPELVQLSSDSEESEGNEEPQRPQHIRFTSESPPVTQRPSGTSRRGSYSPEDSTHLQTCNRARHADNSDQIHHKRQQSKERSSHRNRTHSSSHKDGKREKRREKEPDHGTSSYWHSYSRYKESGRRYFTETHSSYTSYYRSAYNHSQSQGRRRSKDRQRFRSRSWSNSRLSSSSSKRHGRSRSRSNSRINSSSSRLTSNHEDDGRKRKYKTKHLEEHSRKSSEKSAEYHRKKKKKKEKKNHKKSKKKSRSPSIDTAYDDKSEHSRKHHKRNKHKKKSKRHKSKGRGESHSQNITITTDSDSGNTDTTEPSDRNVPVRSTVVVSDSAKTLLLRSSFVYMEQQAAAANNCSITDAENHH